jgi:hypothetical protein
MNNIGAFWICPDHGSGSWNELSACDLTIALQGLELDVVL